jgi:heterogeneous nuclear ribonucleoprotein F/H
MEDNDNVVRLRGLPWSTKPDEIIKFLDGCAVVGDEEGIHIVMGPDGRSTGEAFVDLASADDVKQALTKNKNHIGRRYIDVFKAKRAEMDWALKHSGPPETTFELEAIVRLRGLPYGCTKEEIANFFSGLEIIPNGITILVDQFGRTTGDAFVQFASLELLTKALQKHKETIGHRYIEVFKSTYDELMSTLHRFNRQHFGAGLGGATGGGPMGGFGRSRPPYGGPVDRYGMGVPPPYGGMMPPCDPIGFGGRGGRMTGRGGGGYYSNGYDGFASNYGGGDGLPLGCGGSGSGYGAGGGSGFSGGGGAYSNMASRGMGISGHLGFGMGLGGRGGLAGGGGLGRAKGRPFVTMKRGTAFESETGHTIHMRGLPYSATEDDVVQFFMPLNCIKIGIQYNKDGRASGDADVDFATYDEALEAMKRNKAMMQKRYIELMLKDTKGQRPNNYRGGIGGNSGGYGNGCLYGGSNYTAF